MVLNAKIYKRERKNTKTNATFFTYHIMVLNKNEDNVIYGSVKWYIKREQVEKWFDKENSIFAVVNVSNLKEETFNGKTYYEFGINEINNFETEHHKTSFTIKFNKVLDNINSAKLEAILN